LLELGAENRRTLQERASRVEQIVGDRRDGVVEP
jgi:hypothetical protein